MRRRPDMRGGGAGAVLLVNTLFAAWAIFILHWNLNEPLVAGADYVWAVDAVLVLLAATGVVPMAVGLVFRRNAAVIAACRVVWVVLLLAVSALMIVQSA